MKAKVVLITGANHSIGAATAKALAIQNSSLFITYHLDIYRYSEGELQEARQADIGGDVLYRAMQQSADSLVCHIGDQGGMAVAHEADLTNADNIPLLFDLCKEKLGAVDILVNNHTCCVLETFDPALTSDEGSGIHLPTAATIDAHFAVNARAYALMMSEYLKRYLQ